MNNRLHRTRYDPEEERSYLILNGTEYPDYWVDSILNAEATYSRFAIQKTYHVLLIDEEGNEFTEILNRSDCDHSLQEFLSQVSYPD